MPLRRSMTKSWPTYRPIRLYGSSDQIGDDIIDGWGEEFLRHLLRQQYAGQRQLSQWRDLPTQCQLHHQYVARHGQHHAGGCLYRSLLFVRVLELPPESDFYVRDWTSSPTNRLYRTRAPRRIQCSTSTAMCGIAEAMHRAASTQMISRKVKIHR